MLNGPLPQIEGGRTELAGDADDDCGSVFVMKKVVDDLRGLEGIFYGLFFATLSGTVGTVGRSRDCWVFLSKLSKCRWIQFPYRHVLRLCKLYLTCC